MSSRQIAKLLNERYSLTIDTISAFYSQYNGIIKSLSWHSISFDGISIVGYKYDKLSDKIEEILYDISFDGEDEVKQYFVYSDFEKIDIYTNPSLLERYQLKLLQAVGDSRFFMESMINMGEDLEDMKPVKMANATSPHVVKDIYSNPDPMFGAFPLQISNIDDVVYIEWYVFNKGYFICRHFLDYDFEGDQFRVDRAFLVAVE